MATALSRRTQMTVVAWIASSMEGEVYRRRRLECADRSVLELPGVEHEPLRGSAAIAGVTGDGMSDRGEMTPDLMRAAGLDLDFKCSGGLQPTGRLKPAATLRTDDGQCVLPVDRRVDGRLVLD